MIPVKEKNDFAFSPEVQKENIKATEKQRLIGEHELDDLRYVFIDKYAYRRFKRGMDFLISLLALCVLLVPMLLVAVAIFLDDPGTVIFSQYRVGRNGKSFKLYKFRTMKKDTPRYLSTMEVDDPDKYITRLGYFLRRSSLDELPQLVNILKGDMSLVGPRPLISSEYEIHQMRTKFGVYAVRPGLTGLAQVNGRDTVSPAAKVRWDVKYIECFGFMTDLKIFLATIPKIFGSVGVVEGCTIDMCEDSDTES